MKHLFTLLVLAAAFAAGAAELAVHFTPQNPELDGDPGDAAWERAEWLALSRLDGGVPAKPGRFKILYGLDGFYLFVECFEPQPETLLTAQGELGTVWEDDSLEIFFANGDGPTDQLAVNAAGKRANRRNSNIARGEDASRLWNWETAVRVLGDRWTAEVFIPYAELALNERFLDQLRFNLGRNAWHPRAEHTTYARLQAGSFHDQQNFALLRLLPAPGAESIPARYAANQEAARRGSALAQVREIARKARQGDDFHRGFLERYQDEFARWEAAEDGTPAQAEAAAQLLGRFLTYEREVAREITDALFTPGQVF